MKFRAAAASLLALTATVALVGCSSHKSDGASGGTPASATDQVSDTSTDSATDSAGSLSPSDQVSDTSTDSSTDSASDTSVPTDTNLPSFVTTRPKTTTPVPPAHLQPCAYPSLTAAVRSAHGGMTHAGYVIVFSYHGEIACQLTGYPGLAILDGRDRQIIQAARTPSGYLGGIRNGRPPFPMVVLNAGQSASALLEGLLVDASGKGCPVRRSLLTTPPSTTAPIKLIATTTICSQVQIHPIVAGTTGSKG